MIKVPEGLEDVSKYPDLFDRLYKSKEGEPIWTKEDLEKLVGKNFIRVFQAVGMASTKITKNIYNLFQKNKNIMIIKADNTNTLLAFY